VNRSGHSSSAAKHHSNDAGVSASAGFFEEARIVVGGSRHKTLLAESEVRHLTAMCLRHVAATHSFTVLQSIRNQSEQQSKKLSWLSFVVCTNSRVLVLSACSIITVFHA